MSLITIHGLEKTYNQNTDIEVKVLKGIDLTINPGEFVAIMGPSGSGKSTLMHILGFLDTSTAGSYTFDGEDVTRLEDLELAQIRNKSVGFVFQAFHLLPRLSALENVQLPMLYGGISGEEQTRRATDILTSVGLADRLENTPNKLSGGQKQRVAVARALIMEPRVLFADEPTGNLDTQSGDEVMRLFTKLHDEGNTIIMVTHEPDIAEFASRVIVLRDGVLESDKRQKPKRFTT